MNPLIQEGIHVVHDETDVRISRVMMIGPTDTPYEKGIYFFEIEFPENYPYSPLKAVFKTNRGKTRLHPNFYSTGKVCVSIIGTWNGPGWSACQTLSSVLVTFRSLMIENPLWQEPGFNGEESKRNSDYNQVITHENLRIGLIQMLENTPSGFESFLPIMREHFLQNYDWFINKYSKLLHLTGNTLAGPSVYNFSVKCEYQGLLEKLGELALSYQTKTGGWEGEMNQLLEKIPTNDTTSYRKLIISTKECCDIQRQFDVLLTLLQMRGHIQRSGNGLLQQITT